VSSNDPGSKSDQRDTFRIETLSDGVFAIAITLLVLDIKVPKLENQHLGEALLAQWPSYLAYFLSFLVLGIVWANHHNMFKYIRYTDQALLILNILFLLVVSFTPFPTALLAAYVENPDEKHVAAIVYTGTAALVGLFFFLLRWYAFGNYRLIDSSLEKPVVQRMLWRSLVAPIFCLLALLISLITVEVSLGIYFIVMLFYAFPLELLQLRRKRVVEEAASSKQETLTSRE